MTAHHPERHVYQAKAGPPDRGREIEGGEPFPREPAVRLDVLAHRRLIRVHNVVHAAARAGRTLYLDKGQLSAEPNI